MGLVLRDRLSFCIIEQHVLFLDVANDRYFGVRENTSSALLRIISGEEIDYEEPGLRALLKRGYLVEAHGDTRLHLPDHHVALCSREPAAPAQAADMARALLALGHSALLLRSCRLHVILERIRRRKDHMMPCNATEHSLAAAGALDTIGSIVGRHDRCLLYSLALARLMLSAGALPRIVFGVKLAPFAAHCWVQDGDCVLNDDLDHARLFTPILTV